MSLTFPPSSRAAREHRESPNQWYFRQDTHTPKKSSRAFSAQAKNAVERKPAFAKICGYDNLHENAKTTVFSKQLKMTDEYEVGAGVRMN